MNEKPIAAGKSSFDLIDADKLFAGLALAKDTVFLDVACGRGAYSLAVAGRIGPAGKIYAFDLWRDGIAALVAEIHEKRPGRIHAAVADVSRRIPLKDRSVDICLLAAVLHDLIQAETDQGTLREIARVIKARKTLAVVEFKKIDGPPGPPVRIRLSPQETADRVQPFGFEAYRTVDIGPFNYLSLFTRR